MTEEVRVAIQMTERLVNQVPSAGLRARHRRALEVLKATIEEFYAKEAAQLTAAKPRRPSK